MIHLINIENNAVLNEALNAEQAILYKHSTQCGTSAYALDQVRAFAQTQQDELPIYVVKVIEDRPLSNQIAEHFGVHHQSPQVFLIRDGRQVWNASHYRITESTLAKQTEKHFSAELQN